MGTTEVAAIVEASLLRHMENSCSLGPARYHVTAYCAGPMVTTIKLSCPADAFD
jgi:hypothetical protein